MTIEDLPAADSPTPGRIADLLHDHGVDLDWLDEAYEWMHAHPELSNHEENTAAFIREHLSRWDCEVLSGIGGHGIVAIFRNGDGPTALMRADFDALPVTEETGLPYASTNPGVMHACGHDVHTTCLLGLCAIMDARRDAWSGTFLALFQPAEETTDGARAMVEDGLAERIPLPDVCFGQHVIAGRAGQVMVRPGPILAACDTITVTIEGRSAHGSSPHLSIDPTYVAAMIVVRLQGIVGREVAPSDFAVITVGTLSSGNTNNTIPGTARLVLNCRFYDTTVRDAVYAAIERVVKAEAMASGCPTEPRIEYSARGELTDNDPEVYARMRPVFDATFGEDSITAERWTASEDFSEIPRALDVPYVYWFLGGTPQEQWDSGEDVPGNHASTFAPDRLARERGVLAAGAAVLSYLARD